MVRSTPPAKTWGLSVHQQSSGNRNQKKEDAPYWFKCDRNDDKQYFNTAFSFILGALLTNRFSTKSISELSNIMNMWHIKSIMNHVFTCSNMVANDDKQFYNAVSSFIFAILFSQYVIYWFPTKSISNIMIKMPKNVAKIYSPVLKRDCKWRQAILQRSNFLISWLSLFSLYVTN